MNIEIGDIVRLGYTGQYKNQCSIIDTEAKRKYHITHRHDVIGMTIGKHNRLIGDRIKELCEAQIASSDPAHILRLGFAIVELRRLVKEETK
jgi:FKBP-type peptidyl-prolyl cis-trans isomerase 2